MKRIVVGLDATPSSFHAFETALEWAQIGGAQVETVSVEEAPLAALSTEEISVMQQVEHDRLHAVLGKVQQEAERAGQTVSSHVLAGDPAREITRFLDEHPCDLLVVGTSRHGVFVGALTHSTVLGLIHSAPCPVLLVPPAKAS